jgi:hypothetical protein
MPRLIITSLALVLALTASLSVQAASPLEKNFYLRGQGYDGQLPACEAALQRISGDFAYTQEHFWKIAPVIVGYERVREVAYSPWALGTIPRRFCRATALVQDPRFPQPYRKRSVQFSIAEDTGFSSFGWGVEWCVTGYDWNWAYNPACSMAGAFR